VRKILSLLAVGLLFAYAGASFFVPADRPQLAVLPLVCALGIVVLLASGQRWIHALTPVMLAVVALGVWMPQWLVYAPPTLFNLAAAVVFLGSLRPGREPVITRIARVAHGGALDARFHGYTRTATLAGGLFIVVLGVTAAGLALWAPHTWWWTFCNVIVYPLFAAFFLAEYAVRRRTFPDVEHISPRRLFLIVRRHGLAGPPAVPASEARK